MTLHKMHLSFFMVISLTCLWFGIIQLSVAFYVHQLEPDHTCWFLLIRFLFFHWIIKQQHESFWGMKKDQDIHETRKQQNKHEMHMGAKLSNFPTPQCSIVAMYIREWMLHIHTCKYWKQTSSFYQERRNISS